MKALTWQNYLSTLFNASDLICMGESKYDVATCKASFALAPTPFVSINPFNDYPGHDTRKDENVVSFHNLLLEFDKGTIEEQYALIKLYKIPYSTLVFSGSKSLHAIICLEESLCSKNEFDEIMEMLLIIAPEADAKSRNCSRFTRMGGAVRPENGALQEIIELHPCCSPSTFAKFLNSHAEKVTTAMQAKTAAKLARMRNVDEREPGTLSGTTMRFLEDGLINAGTSRHDRLMSLAFECEEAGWAYDDTLSVCEQMTIQLGIPERLRETESMVNHAYSRKRL